MHTSCSLQSCTLTPSLYALLHLFFSYTLLQLVSYNPSDRPTAGEALLHRWFEQMPVVAGAATPSGTGSVLVTSSVAAATAVRSISNSVGSTVGTVGKRVTEALPTGGCLTVVMITIMIVVTVIAVPCHTYCFKSVSNSVGSTVGTVGERPTSAASW